MSLSLAGAILLTAFSGCGAVKPKDAFLKLVDESAKIESVDADLDLKIKIGENELMKISGNLVLNNFYESGKTDLNIFAMGVGTKQKTYFKDGKTYTQLPMTDKLLEGDAPKLISDEEKLKAMISQNQQKLKEIVTDENVSMEENKEEKTFSLSFKPSSEAATSYVSSSVKAVFDDQETKEQLKAQTEENLRTQFNSLGQLISDEEIAEITEKQLEATEKIISAIGDKLVINSFETIYILDKDNKILENKISVSINLEELLKEIIDDFEENKAKIPVDFSNILIEGTVKYNSIGEETEIDFSEISEDKIVTMKEYTKMLGLAALKKLK